MLKRDVKKIFFCKQNSFQKLSLIILTLIILIILGDLTTASEQWPKYSENPLTNSRHTWGTVLKDGSEYKMYSSATSLQSIILYNSSDGKTWTNQGSIMSIGSSGEWDQSSIWVPMVWKEGDTYHMIYTGLNGTTGRGAMAIGYANSTNGANWTKWASNPVYNSPDSWAHNCTESFGVMKLNSTTYALWFNSLACGTRQSGIATSTNLTNWTAYQTTPMFTGGRFCGSMFKYSNYYYFLIPHYTSGIDYSEIELYRDSTPWFLNTTRTFVKVAINYSISGWDSHDQDTPYLLTDDIFKNSTNLTDNELWAYYAGEYGGVWKTGLAIEPNIVRGLDIIGTTLTPSNSTIDNDGDIILTCNTSTVDNLVNVSFYLTGPDISWHLNQSYNISGTSNSSNISLTSLANGNYTWSCFVYNNESLHVWSANYTFSIDKEAPIITINSPTGTISDITELINVSFRKPVDTARYNVDNGTNITICTSCGSNSSLYLNTLQEGPHIIYVFANDSANHLNDTARSSFKIALNNQYYINFSNNRSISTFNGVEWFSSGNITYYGGEIQPDNTTVVLFHFNNQSIGENDTYIHDFSANNNNGTAKGNAEYNAFGKLAGGFQFDGGGDWVNIGNNQSLNLTNWTVLVWFKINASGASGALYRPFIDKGDIYDPIFNTSDGKSNYYLGIRGNGTIYYGYGDYNGTATYRWSEHQEAGARVLGDTWYHVAYTFNGTTQAVYFNGSLLQNKTITRLPVNTTTTLRLGQEPANFNGSLDEIAIYNRTLTPADILRYYNAGRMGSGNNFTSVTINTTHNITTLTPIWTTANTDANNNISVDISVDGRITWNLSVTNGATLTGLNGSSLVYRVRFNTNGTKAISLLNMNLTWTEGTEPNWTANNVSNYPNITLNFPLNNSNFNTNNVVVNISAVDTLGNISVFNNYGLVSWWRMDDINASGNVVDYMGKNNGTPKGNANQTDAGKFGKGFTFDGSGDYIDISNSNSLNLTNWAISVWFKRSSSVTNDAKYRPFIDKGDVYDPVFNGGDGKSNFYFGMRGNATLYCGYGDYNGSVRWSTLKETGTTLLPNKWYNVVYTFNGTTQVIYKDGSQLTTSLVTKSPPFSTTNLRIGKEPQNFNGSMDEVMIFNRSLSSTEVLGLYANTSAKYLNFSMNVSEGTHLITAYAVDEGGNVNASSPANITVDITYPTLNVTSPVNNSNYSSSVLFNVSSSEEGTGGMIVPNLDSSLISWWRMDDINASGNVVDYMGLNNGTPYGNANQTSAGKMGKAFSFDGINDNINISSSPSLNFSNGSNVTFGLWTKFDSFATGSSYMALITKGNAYTSDSNYEIWMRSNGSGIGKGLSFYPYNGDNGEIGTIALSTGNWYHIVFVINSGTGYYYLNGSLQGSTSMNFGTTNNIVMRIGKSGSLAVDFNGTIDEVMIFNRSLNSSEILSLYNATKLQHTETGLSEGAHTFKAYTQDLVANLNLSDLINFNVD